jgi:hypothetical protein
MAFIDVDKVLAKLTIHEKIQLLSGEDTWKTSSIKRLNIPSITVGTCHRYSSAAWFVPNLSL